MADVRVSDGVVTLSPLCLDDLEAHLAGEDEELVRWLNGGPGTREGTEAYIRECTRNWAAGGPLLAFGVRLEAEGALAGTIDLRFEVKARGRVSLAYGLYPAFRGRGIATRSVHLACGYAAARGAGLAEIKVEPANTASVAVARRSGFTFTGRTKDEDGTELDRYARDL
ncbi:GNAT family N-acetyltransferase [Spongiactinospora sp. 9N601]|uniref:GNAT family N-acetyltransferase n=1 Tax=Spongiactinospora sp. 9N601 TaxID=3375149 RepID=UPI00379B8646